MNAIPQLLPVNQVEHFYRGGQRIARFRRTSTTGTPATAEPASGAPASAGGEATDSGSLRRPEEWIASMTTMTSSVDRGLSKLVDGTVLRDAIEADPERWLGSDHLASFGASTELLVKLLDPEQRLPVHYHPDRMFSQRHLGLVHGKTEAWIVLEADEGAQVRLGFAETMPLTKVRSMLEAHDSSALLASLRTREVQPGDAILVPAGLPHSIDAGIFVLELQEPTDLSILLEAADLPVDLERQGHLDLGYDIALQSLRVEALTDDELAGLTIKGGSGIRELLPAQAETFFRAHRLGSTPGEDMAPGFAVVVVTDGAGEIVTESQGPLEVSRGDAAVVPFAAGGWQLHGNVEAVVCRPPLPPLPPMVPIVPTVPIVPIVPTALMAPMASPA